jgi:hypothetical protein
MCCSKGAAIGDFSAFVAARLEKLIISVFEEKGLFSTKSLYSNFQLV